MKGQGKTSRKRRGGTPARVPPLADADSTLLALHVYRCELVEERVIAVPVKHLSTAPIAAQVISHYLRNADREKFVVLMLDGGGAILGIETIAIGTIARVQVEHRAVFKPALLRNAEQLILGHNHLHDGPEPSRDDKELTRALVKASDVIDLPIVDHIIVAGDKFFSFARAGLL